VFGRLLFVLTTKHNRKEKKDRQNKGQMKRNKGTNNSLPNTAVNQRRTDNTMANEKRQKDKQ
jgi:hypothetical protein